MNLLAKHFGKNLITIVAGFSKNEKQISWAVVFWSDELRHSLLLEDVGRERW